MLASNMYLRSHVTTRPYPIRMSGNPYVPYDLHLQPSSGLPEFSSFFERPSKFTSPSGRNLHHLLLHQSQSPDCSQTNDELAPANFVTCHLSSDEADLNEVRMTSYSGDNGSTGTQYGHCDQLERVPRTRLSTSLILFSCPLCFRDFATQPSLAGHMEKCTLIRKPYKCCSCFRLFASNTSLHCHRTKCLGFLAGGHGQVVRHESTSWAPQYQSSFMPQHKNDWRSSYSVGQTLDKANTGNMVNQTWTPSAPRDLRRAKTPPPYPLITNQCLSRKEVPSSPPHQPPPLLFLGRDEFLVKDPKLLEKNKFFVCQLCHMELQDWPAAARHSMELHV